MNNFKLHTPTRILFGKGAIVDLRDQIPQDARVLITYGGGSVKKTGVLAQVQEGLKGLDVREFGGIEPNPSYETLMKAVQLVRDENITFLLAVGGGSVLDGTKFIAAAAQYTDGVDPWHILETGGTEIRSAIPMGSVLTLPATGSESNAGAVISRKTTGDKQAFHSSFVQPVFAVLGRSTPIHCRRARLRTASWMLSSIPLSSTSLTRLTAKFRIVSPKVFYSH